MNITYINNQTSQMKKFLLFILAIILGLVNQPDARAQLNVVRQVKSEPKTIQVRMMYSYLKYTEDLKQFYLCGKSSNEFDHNTVFFLGDSIESTILTLQDICNLIVNKVAATETEDAVLRYSTILGQQVIEIKVRGNAGSTNFTLAELKKLIDKVRKLSVRKDTIEVKEEDSEISDNY